MAVERIDAVWSHLESEVRGWRRPGQAKKRSLAFSSSSFPSLFLFLFFFIFLYLFFVIAKLLLWLTVADE